jgi:hypothetical protein
VSDIPGSGDCEARIAQWGQPVLLSTSASYLVAAGFVLWWSRRHTAATEPIPAVQIWAFAVGLVLAGLGSMDYHGPAVGPEPLLHDAGLAVALVAALAIDLRQLDVRRAWRGWGLIGLTAAAIAVIAVIPDISPLLAAVAGAGLVIAELVVYRRGIRTPSPALFAGAAVLAIGAAAFALSRTGGPLCDPRSWFQGHGVWHVMTAIALSLWTVTALPNRKDMS